MSIISPCDGCYGGDPGIVGVCIYCKGPVFATVDHEMDHHALTCPVMWLYIANMRVNAILSDMGIPNETRDEKASYRYS